MVLICVQRSEVCVCAHAHAHVSYTHWRPEIYIRYCFPGAITWPLKQSLADQGLNRLSSRDPPVCILRTEITDVCQSLVF